MNSEQRKAMQDHLDEVLGYSLEADGAHVTISLDGCTTQEGIERGLAWAVQQLGDGYSWLDIVYQGVKLVWPGNPLRFYVAGRMDCSEYATRYLLQAGVVLPPAFDDPATISPNDIARWAGVC